jgi:hypothetical protein
VTRTTIKAAIATSVLLASAAAAAAQTPAPPPQGASQANGFAGLWTRWGGVNRDSIQAEARRPPAAPPAVQGVWGAMQPGSPALGERVGEVVRAGDCEGGERIAREAGDFPLVEAVRAHCGRTVQQAVSRR